MHQNIQILKITPRAQGNEAASEKLMAERVANSRVVVLDSLTTNVLVSHISSSLLEIWLEHEHLHWSGLQ